MLRHERDARVEQGFFSARPFGDDRGDLPEALDGFVEVVRLEPLPIAFADQNLQRDRFGPSAPR
jgi:hypothetical protein